MPSDHLLVVLSDKQGIPCAKCPDDDPTFTLVVGIGGAGFLLVVTFLLLLTGKWRRVVQIALAWKMAPASKSEASLKAKDGPFLILMKKIRGRAQ